jgi:biopolymer transport protein TolQ
MGVDPARLDSGAAGNGPAGAGFARLVDDHLPQESTARRRAAFGRPVRGALLVRSRLFRDATKNERSIAGLEAIFEAGFREFARLRQKRGLDTRTQLEGAQRAMRAQLSREMDELEHNLEFLANVGSISPYVGLFGTVWGIMISFQGLANVKEATIATVAPGISEALVATAMGLFAAIPAVWAYNRYATKVERMNSRYEAFAEEFSSILQRQSHAEEH